MEGIGDQIARMLDEKLRAHANGQSGAGSDIDISGGSFVDGMI